MRERWRKESGGFSRRVGWDKPFCWDSQYLLLRFYAAVASPSNGVHAPGSLHDWTRGKKQSGHAVSAIVVQETESSHSFSERCIREIIKVVIYGPVQLVPLSP